MQTKTLHNERLLLEQVSTGDEAAFNALLELHRNKLYNYLYRITKSAEISEELLMDIFLKLWLGRELITDIQNMDAFLHKVAYHKALNFLRLTARRHDLQKLVEYEMDSTATNSAIAKMDEADYKAIIHEVLQQLTPQQKRIFSLSRESGLTHDQIAERLNLSPNTVKNHMTDSLKTIRKHLKNKDIHPLAILFTLLAQ